MPAECIIELCIRHKRNLLNAKNIFLIKDKRIILGNTTKQQLQSIIQMEKIQVMTLTIDYCTGCALTT